MNRQPYRDPSQNVAGGALDNLDLNPDLNALARPEGAPENPSDETMNVIEFEPHGEINKDDPFYEEYFDLHNIIFEVIKNLSRDNLDNEIKFIIEFTKKYDYDICSNNIMEIYERY